MKVIVIGDPEAVLGFSLAGVDGSAAENSAEANEALDTALKSREIGIVLVTKDVARMMQPRMDALKLRSTMPLVVEIPSSEGVPEGEPSLSEVVLRAIGIKL